MLSISQAIKGTGQGDYYLDLAREDYYLRGGEPPGRWYGGGARELKLSGLVHGRELKTLMLGFAPDGGKALVQNAGSERRSAWDLTFSAPKSVSVAWSQATPLVRREIETCHQEAVKKALEYLEANAGFTRRGKGGSFREETKFVAALFQHGTSRAQDPQLHTHALLMNLGPREDGSWGTLETKELFRTQLTAGALYRAELARGLELRLRLRARRAGRCFEIDGVDDGLIGEFSKRRKEVLRKLAERGASGPRAAELAALATRSKKAELPREELFCRWQAIGSEGGWSREELNELIQQPARYLDPEKEFAEALRVSLLAITSRSSHFSKSELICHVAEEAQTRCLGADEVLGGVERVLQKSAELVRLGCYRGKERFTTQEMLRLEEKMLQQVAAGSGQKYLEPSKELVTEAIANRPSISKEQEVALRYITQGNGQVKVVTGCAGSGKSFMLGAAREVWEGSHFKVYGAALSGKAAQELEGNSGIRSDTVYSTLKRIESGELRLHSKAVLVIDEAAMVGTRQMAELVRFAAERNARLVLVGDAGQLQPIEAGGAFSAIAKMVGEVKLSENRRQREAWSRDAVHDIASGRASHALSAFKKRGALFVAKTRDGAIHALINDWSASGGAKSPAAHLLLAGTNLEVLELNRRAQRVRGEAGLLGSQSIEVRGESFSVGDRVLFTRNSRIYNVSNGSLGTLKRITSGGRLIVELQDGREVSFSPTSYDHLRLGYAVTTHKAQGITAENVYVLAGGPMQHRELSYVQLSRGRGKTKIYTDELHAGKDFAELSRAMSTSREKKMALDLGQQISR